MNTVKTCDTYIHRVQEKSKPKCFCHILYKTRPILIKVGTVSTIWYKVLQAFSTSPKYCLYTTLWNLKSFLWKFLCLKTTSVTFVFCEALAFVKIFQNCLKLLPRTFLNVTMWKIAANRHPLCSMHSCI